MNKSKTNNNLPFSWLPYLVFFLASFIYFGFFGNYIFFFQEKSSLFFFSSDFLRENLHQPGGFLLWLGKLFSTFYFYPGAGAMILSALLTLIIILISEIIYVLSGHYSKAVSLIIGASLFYIQTDYRFLLFNILGILIQLALFWFILKYLQSLKGWAAVIIAPLLIYATGGFAWVFLLIVTLYFVFDKENNGWIRLIALWGFGIITFYISKEYLFFQSGKTLLTFPFSDQNTGCLLYTSDAA